jgi:hypothetical protein
MTELRVDDVQLLADRLYSLGGSSITTIGQREQAYCVAAGRTIRARMRDFELATGREISTVLLCGRGM